MSECSFYDDDDHPPGDGGPFAVLTDAMVTGYLFARRLFTDDAADAVVTVHAEHDGEHDVFLLEVGIGESARVVMTAEREARVAAQRDGGA